MGLGALGIIPAFVWAGSILLGTGIWLRGSETETAAEQQRLEQIVQEGAGGATASSSPELYQQAVEQYYGIDKWVPGVSNTTLLLGGLGVIGLILFARR